MNFNIPNVFLLVVGPNILLSSVIRNLILTQITTMIRLQYLDIHYTLDLVKIYLLEYILFSALDKYTFLGISIVGQSNDKGDGGIYIGSIMKG